MEINKQLFEDVLAGKLKGAFVLRDGDKVQSHKLSIDTNAVTYPIVLRGGCYTYEGEFNLIKNHHFDIIDFIPDTNMKENELTIEIPEGKTVDWDESKKQNKIVLKDKQLTYEDICNKLFKDDHYSIAWDGSTIKCCSAIYNASNATTEHQLECILAKNKLANVAKYLNDGWEPKQKDYVYGFILDGESKNILIPVHMWNTNHDDDLQFVFKTSKLAQQAIEILGEKTVKLALEPLGI